MAPPIGVSVFETPWLIQGGLFAVGGVGYTITYILMTRQSIRDRTYTMPVLPLAFNFAWECIFALFITDQPVERVVFSIWMIIDLGLVYGVMKYGAEEWKHAPMVGRNIGKIFVVLFLWWCWALYSLGIWWLDDNNPVNPKVGRAHKGTLNRDAEEFGFWTAVVAQVILSVSFLAQLLVRGSSRGDSYWIFATRFIGSLLGLNGCQLYSHMTWPQLYGYYSHPVAICLSITWVVADLVYWVVLVQIKRAEAASSKGKRA